MRDQESEHNLLASMPNKLQAIYIDFRALSSQSRPNPAADPGFVLICSVVKEVAVHLQFFWEFGTGEWSRSREVRMLGAGEGERIIVVPSASILV